MTANKYDKQAQITNIDKAMGVATYRTTKEVPKEMKRILPDTAELVKLL